MHLLYESMLKSHGLGVGASSGGEHPPQICANNLTSPEHSESMYSIDVSMHIINESMHIIGESIVK